MTRRAGLTLAELVVVLVVLAALAALVVPLVGGVREDAAATATRSTLQQVAAAVARFRVDVGQTPAALKYLYGRYDAPNYEPLTRRGWNGPYLAGAGRPYAVDVPRGFTTGHGTAGDPCPVDGWLNPVVLDAGSDGATVPTAWTWLQSAGPNGRLEAVTVSANGPTPAAGSDDLLVPVHQQRVTP